MKKRQPPLLPALATSLLVSKARSRLARAVLSVKPTPEVEEHLTSLTEKARKAKTADFLVKYRAAA